MLSMYWGYTTVLFCYAFSLTVGLNIEHSRYKRESSQMSTPSFPEIIPGTDGPADSETLGYTLNHHAILVSNLTNTRKFYGDVLGMRHVFTFRLNPQWSFMFLGHAQGGKNGTGFQDAATIEMEMRNREGLLEFLSYEGATPPPTQTRPHSSFSHLGLVVPNILAAQARMEAKGVTIVKRVGDAAHAESVIPAAFGFPDKDAFQEASPGLQMLGFDGVLIIADPDGNLLEVMQQ